MADVQSNIQVSIDTTQALASIKNLQRQISAFHSSMAKGGAAANAVSAQMQQTLLNSINAGGKFSAQIRTIKTTTESFTDSLQKNKFSIGEYFRYAGGASKTFGRLFKTEFDTINKVARENVKDLQTQYIRLGRDASGAMKSIAVRPLSLDMTDLGTRTQITAQKQALLNQLLRQGSTNLLNFGKNTQWAGRQLMVGFTIPLMAVGSAAAKTFMDMETQAIKFRKVYGDLFTPEEESRKALKDIQDLGREFTKYGVAASETVGVAAEAAAAGFAGLDLQRQTEQSIRLSILGQVDYQKALETTISVQNAFSISSDQLATSIDFLNAVENQTVLSLDDITTAIPKSAPIIQQLGGDIRDLAFFMTAMKEGGINASEGANALKSGLASMINPTGKAVEMLESFGINVRKIVVDNKGDLKKTVIEFATALNQLDPLNRAQAIEQMFGKFQFARLSTLFANVTKEGTQASRVLDLAGASMQELASLSEKELGMTSESAMNKFKGAVESLKLSLIPLGEEFLKVVTPVAEFVTKLLDRFNGLSDNTKKVIVTLTAIIGGLGPVFLMTFGLLANGLANIIKGFTVVKSLFNKTGQETGTLGNATKYMTAEQRNAAAVAASLDQVHTKLKQTFTSEAAAVNLLTQAYQRAVAAQAAFMPVAAPMRRGPVAGGAAPTKRAKGKPAVVGGTGNKDSELALLMPGETVIPTKMSQKYGSIINAMIADRVPGYEFGKTTLKDNEVPIYPEYAMRLQDAKENMGQRSGATGVPNVLAPLALRIGEARGIAPTQRQVDAGKFDGIFDEYQDVTTQFVDKVNSEYDDTFKDIKDENERMQKAWSSAGKHVEKQVDSISSTTDRSVVRKVFALDEDEYGTIPTDSREKGGTAPNRARRGAFKSRLTGFRSYTSIRGGAKRLFSRKTDVPSESLQMGHVFGPRTVPIETLESDSRKTASVGSARKVLDRGKKDGAEYARGIDSTVKDPYELSQDRKSPHRRAAPDGKSDGTAYAQARDKAITQSGRKRRVSTRPQGPAPIGVLPQPGATILNVVAKDPTPPPPPPPTRRQAFAARAKVIGGKMTGMGGGMGLLGANMGLSMLPDFAGKGVMQGGLAGANLGMMFGPKGMAAGAAIGLVTSAFTTLIAKQKEHAAMTKSTFAVSTSLITAFGDKVLDTKVNVTELNSASSNLKNSLGMLSPEIQSIIDGFKDLPEDDPLALFIKKISKTGQDIGELRGNIRSQVTTAIAIGGLSPENAQKYVFTLMSAAGKAHEFGAVWKSVSKDVVDASTATAASFSKIQEELGKRGGASLFQNIDMRTGILSPRPYKELGATATVLADQMYSFFGIMSNGAFTFDQIQERIKALDSSSLDAKSSVLALRAAVHASGDPELVERFKLIEKMFLEGGKAARATTGDYIMAQLALEMLAKEGKTSLEVLFADEGQRSLARRYATDLQLLEEVMKKKGFKEFVDELAKQREIFNNTFNKGYQDLDDTTGGLSKASKAYLKVLDAEINGLEAKRDAQKNANDESQRQIDLQMKLSDLAKQSVLAKISGDFIGAASLQQQAQNVEMEFNQETELRKKDAEIARLKARAQEIKDGASLTRAEKSKIPKNKIKAASGGMIRGAGTATSDSIPAYLSNGEYVIKADSVKKYGTETFDALNTQKFAAGGLVPGYKDGGLGTRPKYGKRLNAFQRYVANLTQAHDESLLGGDPLGVVALLRKFAGQSREGDSLAAAMLPLNLTGTGMLPRLGKSVPSLSAPTISKLTAAWKKINPNAPLTQRYDYTNTDPLHGPLFIGKQDVGSDNVRRSLSYRLPKNQFGKGDDLVGLTPMFSTDPKYLIERYMAGDKAVMARMQYEQSRGLNNHPLSIQALFKSVATPFTGKLYRGMTSQSVADTLPKHIVEAIEKARETGDFSALLGKNFIMRRASFSSDSGVAGYFAPGYSRGPQSSLLLEATLFGRKVTPTSKMFPDKKFLLPYGQGSPSQYQSELESLVGGKFTITDFDGKTLKVDARAKGGPVDGGTPYVVGEKGPELFVPKSSGKIIPNKDMPRGFKEGGLASRPKYGKRQNAFQRYVSKLTKAHDKSPIGGDALGVVSMLRNFAGQGREGDKFAAAMLPLNLTGMGIPGKLGLLGKGTVAATTGTRVAAGASKAVKPIFSKMTPSLGITGSSALAGRLPEQAALHAAGELVDPIYAGKVIQDTIHSGILAAAKARGARVPDTGTIYAADEFADESLNLMTSGVLVKSDLGVSLRSMWGAAYDEMVKIGSKSIDGMSKRDFFLRLHRSSPGVMSRYDDEPASQFVKESNLALLQSLGLRSDQAIALYRSDPGVSGKSVPGYYSLSERFAHEYGRQYTQAGGIRRFDPKTGGLYQADISAAEFPSPIGMGGVADEYATVLGEKATVGAKRVASEKLTGAWVRGFPFHEYYEGLTIKNFSSVRAKINESVPSLLEKYPLLRQGHIQNILKKDEVLDEATLDFSRLQEVYDSALNFRPSGPDRQETLDQLIKLLEDFGKIIGQPLIATRFAKGGMVKKYAMGGLIKGPGTGISDSIQAGFGYAGGGSIRVSNGEYVVKASSVRDYGVKTMDAINSGTATVGTNSGGTVYNINMPITSNNADAEGVANEVMRKLKLEVSKNNKSNRVGL